MSALEIMGASIIFMMLMIAGASNGVPVIIGGRTVPLIPDTGSSLSLISNTEAKRLGLRMIDVSIWINTSTGRGIPARTAVAVLGSDGVAEILAAEREAVVTCEFCRQRYVVGEPELREIQRQLAAS